MAIKQVGIKNSQGTYEYTDIGANSTNVSMTSGNDLQTDFSALQTQVGNKANATDLAALQTVVAGKQDIMQYSTMPTAAASNVDKIVQYIGATSSSYTNGYFYKCEEDDSTTPSTYSWEVVSGGGVETMHEADYRQLKEDYPDPSGGKGVYDPGRYFFIDDISLDGWIMTDKESCLAGDESATFQHDSIHPYSMIKIVAEADSTKSMPVTGNNSVYPIYARVNYQNEGEAQIVFDALTEGTDFWLLIRNEDDIQDNITPSGSASGGSGNILNWDGAGTHNSIYRGKCLGSEYTAAQKAEVAAGTFEDMYIGDYWTVYDSVNDRDINYRIAAFDYWLETGDEWEGVPLNPGGKRCTEHHVVIVPDINLTNAKMNNTATTVGGYIGSDLYTGNNSNTGLSDARDIINSAFGSANILNHREMFVNAVDSNGMASTASWYDSTIDLMNENMVYGSSIFKPVPYNNIILDNRTLDKTQLMLFNFKPEFISSNTWLRDTISTTHFARTNGYGAANHQSAADSNIGIRPCFALK